MLQEFISVTLLFLLRDGLCLELTLSECAKAGAEKAPCGETVVQKGVFGKSVSPLPP